MGGGVEEKSYKKNSVFLWHTVFFIVLFRRFQFKCDLHDLANQENNKSYYFYLNLMKFLKNHIFCKITMKLVILKLTLKLSEHFHFANGNLKLYSSLNGSINLKAIGSVTLSMQKFKVNAMLNTFEN